MNKIRIIGNMRGHSIEMIDGVWYYLDNMEEVINNRDCNHCGLPSTKDSHDKCIGNLPDVKNACCGHGDFNDSYVQFCNGSELRGREALKWMENNKK